MYIPLLYENVGRFLLAPNLFAYLEEVLQAAPPAGGGMQSLALGSLLATATGGGFGGGPPARVTDLSDFVRIGLSMEALLWAVLGGRVACYFASGRDRENTSQISASSGRPDAGEQGRRDETTGNEGSRLAQNTG
jgi:hypothetical protein